MNRLYLAGGMKSGWGLKVKYALPEWEIYDPATHGLNDEKAYTQWDLAHIAKADWILANMESDNPSGYGLHLEVGYAKALSKCIVFVDQTSESKRKYFGMVRACADATFSTLDEAIAYLNGYSGVAP